MYTTYPMDQVLEAYRALVDGRVSGRAVVVPHA
jgi:propanol-preferring alcohol dehydrogenase